MLKYSGLNLEILGRKMRKMFIVVEVIIIVVVCPHFKSFHSGEQ